MLKIGDFSKLSRISIKMLRHYDEIGLLRPQSVDAFNSYRYYSAAQLPLAGRIQMLKALGFGLADIGALLAQYQNAAELERFLLQKRRELDAQNTLLQQRIRLLDNTLDTLRKDGNAMEYCVNLKSLPEQYVATVRQILPRYDQEGTLWHILNEEIAPLHPQISDSGFAATVFHDHGYKEFDVDIEVQLAVSGSYPDTANVRFKTLPPMQIASAVFQGSYDQITAVNEVIARWIEANGYSITAPMFMIYHVSPNETQNIEEYVTEICYPVGS